MGFLWRDAAQVLADLLRRYGVDPDRVHDVVAAWQAFTDFPALPVDGLGPVENDADGFWCSGAGTAGTTGCPV